VKPDLLVNPVYKANPEEMVILDQLENEVLAVLLDNQKMASKVKKEIKVLLDYQVIADSAANLERSVIKEHEVFLAEEKDALFDTFIGQADDPNSPLQQLMHDKFGNYTVQCVIKHSRGGHREEIVKRLKACEAQLESSNTGKHILAKLKEETG